MKLIVAKNYEEASDEAFKVMKDYLKPGKVLGLATGSTPLGLYKRMIEDHKNNVIDLAIPSDLAVISTNGNGVIFDFLLTGVIKSIPFIIIMCLIIIAICANL